MKVYNRYNAPKGKKAIPGSDIYEYDYIDPNTKKLTHKKINQQEKIQSCLPMTDYKKQIENGELKINDNRITEGVRDFTGVPGNKADFIDFITKVSSMDKDQIDNLVKGLNKENDLKPSENKQENREPIVKAPQAESDNSGNNQEVPGGAN